LSTVDTAPNPATTTHHNQYAGHSAVLATMHVRELTRIMETEIHEAVLSCTRARRQVLEDIGVLSLACDIAR